MGFFKTGGRYLAVYLLLTLGVLDTALAQTRPQAPRLPLRSGEPDVRVHTLEGNRPVLPRSGPAVPPGHESFAPSGAEQIRFKLHNIDVRGTTVYSPEELQAVFSSRYGTVVSLAEIYALAGEIQRRYRDAGYFLSQVIVPPQRIVGGRMYVEVLEGYIDSVVIEGAVGPVEWLIKGYLEHVTMERPLRLSTLERGLLLANDLPGIEAKGVLRASEAAVGASQLVVIAGRKRFDGLVLLDNLGSTFTGQWEVAVRAGTNSFTRFGESIGITGLVSDPDEGFGGNRKNQRVGMLTSSLRIGDRGTYLSSFLSYGDSNPGDFLSEFDYDSTKLLANLKVVHPIIRTRSHNLFVEGGFDFIDSKTDIFGNLSFIEDHLRVLSLAVAYDFRDPWGGSTYLNLGVRQGLSGFGSTDAGDPLASRFDADGKFTSMQLTASRLQTLTDTLALYALVKAQYAFDPVLADEEFNLGSIDFGRGYDPKELSGDDGIGTTLELQYTRSSPWSFLERYQLFGFYDFGAVRQKSNHLLPSSESSLASSGVGLRTWLTRGLSLELQVAKPLTRRSQRADDSKDPEFLLRAIARF
ncbi:ShlB/FhaC/HecB family hemolysin secretion/activation protein [Candidatus Thiosymbion oneisti]|uniref:ShlB/FhaC/HecB family hemolysin secretion/activation protein n=1 Tax=Candidatus Thiosymbion oneisti TaxID=589554 RepID=UPI0013FD3E4B|nr:ShlB/FhaC/HecB family hemolysin secretion/activation protein [Candidatus Thiosymbion oneisti]